MSKLKEKRKVVEVKQTELAKVCGVGTQMVSLWELGKRELPVRHAKKIAEYLGCGWKDLYD